VIKKLNGRCTTSLHIKESANVFDLCSVFYEELEIKRWYTISESNYIIILLPDHIENSFQTNVIKNIIEGAPRHGPVESYM